MPFDPIRFETVIRIELPDDVKKGLSVALDDQTLNSLREIAQTLQRVGQASPVRVVRETRVKKVSERVERTERERFGGPVLIEWKPEEYSRMLLEGVLPKIEERSEKQIQFAFQDILSYQQEYARKFGEQLGVIMSSSVGVVGGDEQTQQELKLLIDEYRKLAKELPTIDSVSRLVEAMGRTEMERFFIAVGGAQARWGFWRIFLELSKALLKLGERIERGMGERHPLAHLVYQTSKLLLMSVGMYTVLRHMAFSNAEISGYMSAVVNLLKTMNTLILMPILNIFGMVLLPIMLALFPYVVKIFKVLTEAMEWLSKGNRAEWAGKLGIAGVLAYGLFGFSGRGAMAFATLMGAMLGYEYGGGEGALLGGLGGFIASYALIEGINKVLGKAWKRIRPGEKVRIRIPRPTTPSPVPEEAQAGRSIFRRVLGGLKGVGEAMAGWGAWETLKGGLGRVIGAVKPVGGPLAGALLTMMGGGYVWEKFAEKVTGGGKLTDMWHQITLNIEQQAKNSSEASRRLYESAESITRGAEQLSRSAEELPAGIREIAQTFIGFSSIVAGIEVATARFFDKTGLGNLLSRILPSERPTIPPGTTAPSYRNDMGLVGIAKINLTLNNTVQVDSDKVAEHVSYHLIEERGRWG